MIDVDSAIMLTVKRMETTPFIRGINDCGCIVGDYVYMRTGNDPFRKWRGLYFTDEAAEQYIREAGGNCNLVEEGMWSIGVEPKLDAPVRGDIAVMDYHGDEVVGVFLDPFYLFKSKNGARRARYADILKVWSCD